MRTFGPHRPSSFFEVFYQYQHGNFLRRAGRSIIVARLGRAMVVRRLVIATKVVFVMVVWVMVVLLVVVVVPIATARLAIFGVVAALLVGVLGLVPMDVARFARKLQQSFSLRLVLFVVTVARQFATAIAIAIVAIFTPA